MKRTIQNIVILPTHIKAYRFIEKYIKKNLYAPHKHEVAKGAGVTVRHIFRILEDLETLGYITMADATPRSIKIVKPLQ
jgi:hypothetical protein